MRTRSKLLVAAFTAALLLSMAVASASANRLSVSNKNFRIVWAPLHLTNTGGIRINIDCNVTLEGSFHSATIRKVVGALIGHISRATAQSATCTGGSATVRQGTLPWHVRYGGFTGNLPNITGVSLQLVGASFEAEAAGLNCTTTTTATEPAVGIANVTPETGRITGLRADETRTIPLEGPFCGFAGRGQFRNTGTVTLLGNTTAITITLI